jgi:hypothetical protein
VGWGLTQACSFFPYSKRGWRQPAKTGEAQKASWACRSLQALWWGMCVSLTMSGVYYELVRNVSACGRL